MSEKREIEGRRFTAFVFCLLHGLQSGQKGCVVCVKDIIANSQRGEFAVSKGLGSGLPGLSQHVSPLCISSHTGSHYFGGK